MTRNGRQASYRMTPPTHAQMEREPKNNASSHISRMDRGIKLVNTHCGNNLLHLKTALFPVLTQTHTFNGPFSGLPGWAGTRKVKQIWILLKQETVSGRCKSAPRSRQITMPAPHHSVFYRPDALPATQPTASKRWRPSTQQVKCIQATAAFSAVTSATIYCHDGI